MKQVLCTIIEGSSIKDLKEKVSEFTDMDLDYFDWHPTARTFTHYQTETGGIEYVCLLDSDGKVLDFDTVVGCIVQNVEAISATA